MAKASLSETAAHSRNRSRALSSGGRRGSAAKLVENDRAIIATSPPLRQRAGSGLAAPEVIPTQPLGRTFALWILVGALWLSIGMIVSATLVTMAFLA